MAGERREIWFERRKWPATPHYGHPAWVLGENEYGSWFEVRIGVPWHRGDEFLFDGPFDAVVLVSRHDDFIAWFFGDDVGQLDIYVDIVTAVDRGDGSLTAVDLDLDVIRVRDTRAVEVIDQDEFATHQVELGYPPDAIAHAERVAADVLTRMQEGAAPFDDLAPVGWFALRKISTK